MKNLNFKKFDKSYKKLVFESENIGIDAILEGSIGDVLRAIPLPVLEELQKTLYKYKDESEGVEQLLEAVEYIAIHED